ncbi:MAG: transketolase [Candidatus Omnitrophica bacterium]|nr:transketolase [Candidatus Omnitrophota bacterium]
MHLTGKILRKKSDQIRHNVIDVSVRNGAGHIAPSLSCVDILVALYYSVMNYKASDPCWDKRDRLIFSKAHGCYALYAILADKGVLPKKEWKGFYSPGNTLLGCMERRLDYGLEAGCGSLGHGLPMAVGLAFGAKLQNKKYRIFCVIGDGEMQEGTTWEALQYAVKHEVDNLTIVIDDNRLQAMDFIINVLDRTTRDKIKRLKGFGLSPVICNGHDVVKLSRVLKCANNNCFKMPSVIIAQTVKGYGLKCMEGIPKFHFRIPMAEELRLGRTYACRL